MEICVEGFWGTVCDMYSWSFGRKGAAVACRQLGMKTIGIYLNVQCNLSSFVQVHGVRSHIYAHIVFLGAIAVGGAYFGEGSGPIHRYISCGGTESNLAQCSRGSVGRRDCHHGRDVGVICQGNSRIALKTTVTSLIVTFASTVPFYDM